MYETQFLVQEVMSHSRQEISKISRFYNQYLNISRETKTEIERQSRENKLIQSTWEGVLSTIKMLRTF